MKVTDVVTEVKMELQESQNARDARIEQLWMKIDFQKKGELDWKGLQRGLTKIDHPLKNADVMLKEIIRAVDRNGDGKIQYEEFRVFVEAAERQLFLLFKSIDRDNNGRLDKDELQMAFQRAGLAVSKRRLHDFFADVDVNKDGFISFDEWRDFLLFMPQQHHETTLRAVFSFYSEVVTVNAEGDSIVSDEALESLGTSRSLMQILFGSILNLAARPDQQGIDSTSITPDTKTSSSTSLSSPQDSPLPEDQLAQNDTMWASRHSHRHPGSCSTATTAQATLQGRAHIATGIMAEEEDFDFDHGSTTKAEEKESVLIRYVPDPGYFVAGAVAGGISRTATAPLDRLKVYLLVNTTTGSNVALEAAKKRQPWMAVKNAGRPLFAAVADLYKSGGVRGFFAGNGLNVIKIMPETAIRFGAYEAAKKALTQFEGHGDATHINPYSKFVAGGVAGMIAQFCVYPLDTLKFRLQSEYISGGPRGNDLLRQTIRNMWADGGVRATYRGVTMGLVGMFPYSAIDMGTFEVLKTTYCRHRARKLGIHEEDCQPSTVATGIMGATSGAFGASVVYPLNVLRTRLQTQGTKMHPARYTGIWDVAGKTIKNEGVRGLYKGLMPNLLKVAPALSITWMVYENAKHLMNLH